MERYDLRADTAFAMLVRVSQQWQTPVTELAERIARRDPDCRGVGTRGAAIESG